MALSKYDNGKYARDEQMNNVEAEYLDGTVVETTTDHPDYYGGKENTYETIKVWFAIGWGEAACLANAYKYMTRAGKKPGESKLKDLRKARHYLDMLIEYLEGEE